MNFFSLPAVSVKGYRVQHSTQKFTEFMLIVEPSNTPVDVYRPQSVGTFQLYGDSLTMHSEYCPNAVTHTSSIPKSEIQVMWTAPPAGSGCIRFREALPSKCGNLGSLRSPVP
ncbi:spondin-1-like [Oratosquilla oratoria]|uniref:spondin-1-like n=1 Tax=Oratosquilla oratoria TaxID=337810 RepID=UPI003F761D97